MLPPRHPLPPPLSPPFRRGGLPSPEPGPNRTCPAFQEENQGRRADENTVRALATSGARLGSRDSLGSSPLHMAALRGHRQVVEALVDLGANVDELGGSGQTPLEVADQAGMAATVALLRRCCHTAAPAVTVADVTPGEVAPSGWLQRGGGAGAVCRIGYPAGQRQLRPWRRRRPWPRQRLPSQRSLWRGTPGTHGGLSPPPCLNAHPAGSRWPRGTPASPTTKVARMSGFWVP